jgi:hypothetical protein
MRNVFFPNKQAEYMTVARLREIGMVDAVVERDWTFGMAKSKLELPAEESKEAENPKQSAEQKEAPVTVKIDLLEVKAHTISLKLRVLF